MSRFYNSKRTRNLFRVDAIEPYRLSRSKIDLFLNCPKCFYLDRRLGVAQPPSMPFSLNAAVDRLLKREFDIHRAKAEPHPLMRAYGIDAIPLAHEEFDTWRDSLAGGITYFDKERNLLLSGGIDDVWINPEGEYMIVDYKATSKNDEVTIDADWQIGYKRQMEMYQWLFRKNGHRVSDTGYFVYANGDADKEAFDGKLEFRVKIIPYDGDDQWVEGAIRDAYECLRSDAVPPAGPDCDFCRYRAAARAAEEK